MTPQRARIVIALTVTTVVAIWWALGNPIG